MILQKEKEQEATENNNPPPEDSSDQNQPTTDPQYQDFGPETIDYPETYAPRGKEFEFILTRARKDGIYVSYFDMKEKTWPAGSPEEYVQYEAEYTSASTFEGMKENMSGEEFKEILEVAKDMYYMDMLKSLKHNMPKS